MIHSPLRRVGNDGVIFAEREIPYNEKPYVLCGYTRLHERYIFGDGIILASRRDLW